MRKVPLWSRLVLLLIVGGAALFGYLRWYSRSVVAAAVPPGSRPVVTTLDPAASDRLLQVVTEARERLDLPGLQVAVVRGGEVVWAGGAGWADPPARRVVSVEDRYHIGSVSKLYTAAVILKLAEEGRLSLDDTVSRFIPGIPNGEQITVRQLLNHTGGLGNYTEDMAFNLKTVLLRRRWSVDEVLDVIRQQAPRSAPGTEHYYSNSNYVLLGRIAEAAGARPFSDLLHDEVLRPLGLTNTYLAAGEDRSPGTVRGYDVTVLGTGRLGIKMDMERFRAPFETSAFAAGAVTASAAEVARFTYGLFGGRLLADSTLQSMLTFVDAPDEDMPEQTGYGLGVRRLVIGGEEMVGHTGTLPGYSNVALYSPAHDHAIAVLSNLSMSDVTQVLAEVHAVLKEAAAAR
ncbi:D-alanyl-D-alanine carboxypeptidase [Symbiobacterium terraclitae]|uniref:D-alanyl-D-alanine carboxypeptidase n=1 Tax=Symbiobacterium terraclitae TaxID=557451 RepID=A0ABS4JTY5_9FIRM|nr:serine hydrolase domain-containing protein [Symbiobacterium terraclitae]MBP2019001.1 D-alanyl-D-alanine carboxypeptidase [Symbiobacterium terraclitae]